MRFTFAAVAALAAGAMAQTGVVYTTDVVTAYTTYCPEATTLTHGNETYTVTEVSDVPPTIRLGGGDLVATASIPERKNRCQSRRDPHQ